MSLGGLGGAGGAGGLEGVPRVLDVDGRPHPDPSMALCREVRQEGMRLNVTSDARQLNKSNKISVANHDK